MWWIRSAGISTGSARSLDRTHRGMCDVCATREPAGGGGALCGARQEHPHQAVRATRPGRSCIDEDPGSWRGEQGRDSSLAPAAVAPYGPQTPAGAVASGAQAAENDRRPGWAGAAGLVELNDPPPPPPLDPLLSEEGNPDYFDPWCSCLAPVFCRWSRRTALRLRRILLPSTEITFTSSWSPSFSPSRMSKNRPISAGLCNTLG